MTDAEVIERVLGVLQSATDWSAERLRGDIGEVRVVVEDEPLRWVLAFEEWDPDVYVDDDFGYDDLVKFAQPRVEALQALFAERIDATWEQGAIEDDGDPLTEHRGWHNDRFSVEIGTLIHDNGLPVMAVLRAYESPKS